MKKVSIAIIKFYSNTLSCWLVALYYTYLVLSIVGKIMKKMCNLETKKSGKIFWGIFSNYETQKLFENNSPRPYFYPIAPSHFQPLCLHSTFYCKNFILHIFFHMHHLIQKQVLLPSLGFYYNEFIFSEILFFFLILKNYGISSSDILLFRQ